MKHNHWHVVFFHLPFFFLPGNEVVTVKTPAFAESVTEGDVRWEKGNSVHNQEKNTNKKKTQTRMLENSKRQMAFDPNLNYVMIYRYFSMFLDNELESKSLCSLS